jgi:hypothetical protein
MGKKCDISIYGWNWIFGNKKPKIRITKIWIVSQQNTTYSQSKTILTLFLMGESMLRLYSCGNSTLSMTTIVNGFNTLSKTSRLASNVKTFLDLGMHECYSLHQSRI